MHRICDAARRGVLMRACPERANGLSLPASVRQTTQVARFRAGKVCRPPKELPASKREPFLQLSPVGTTAVAAAAHPIRLSCGLLLQSPPRDRFASVAQRRIKPLVRRPSIAANQNPPVPLYFRQLVGREGILPFDPDVVPLEARSSRAHRRMSSLEQFPRDSQ